MSNDRRWTTVQEVRLVTPALFAALLTEARDQQYWTVRQFNVSLDAVQDTDASYLHKKLRDALIDDDPGSLGEALIVEATAVHWVKAQPRDPGGFSTLQYLPGFSQQASLSVLADFDSATTDTGSDWRLLSIPFLGRLQPQSRDGLGDKPPAPDSALQWDPLLALQRDPTSRIPQLLASWEESRARAVPVAPFDRAAQRQWGRLDPASLAESWFRLQTPADETPRDCAVASVLTARAGDSPGRLSRPAALSENYESWRASLPPGRPAAGARAPDPVLVAATAKVLWRRSSLCTLQGDISGKAGDHRLYIAGAMLTASGLSGAAEGITRFPAATLMPALFASGGFVNPEPVSLAVSPYVRLSWQEFIPVAAPDIVYGDLICVDPTGTRLTIVASQVWQGEQANDADGRKTWAKEVRDRLATGSKVAILRLRSIQPAEKAPDVATVKYSFDILPYPDNAAIARLSHSLRAALPRLRYEEGQLSAQPIPQNVTAFEAAPPQVRGVQPIYQTARPKAKPVEPAPAPAPPELVWPWGLSALRFHLQATEGPKPEDPHVQRQPFGFPGDGSLIWWQAVSHFVQFLSGGENVEPPLPLLFRAPAVPSMLSASPHAVLPPVRIADGYQPVLPGAWDLILVGGRPGAPFVFRHHLIRQGATADPSLTVASGSVPVQHRMPRPVAIPPALETCASYFSPAQTAAITTQPFDTAFFAAAGAVPAGLNITLVSPWTADPNGKPDPYLESATLPPDWKGTLRFNIAAVAGDSASNWDINCSLEDGITALEADKPSPGLFTFAGDALNNFMSARQHGDAVKAVMRIERKGTTSKGYRQRLEFPLRVARAGSPPSPFTPVFALFEDPEYNSRLVS